MPNWSLRLWGFVSLLYLGSSVSASAAHDLLSVVIDSATLLNQVPVQRSACLQQSNGFACAAAAETLHRFGGKDEKAEALNLAYRGCDANYARSCGVAASVLYSKGKFAESHRLAMSSCHSNSGLGCAIGGFIQETGAGGVEINPRAIDVFRRACELDSGAGCFALGLIVVRSDEKRRAALYFKKSCENGNYAGCIELVGSFFHDEIKDLGVNSREEGLDIIGTLCNWGYGAACRYLGYYIREGVFSSDDADGSIIRLFTKGCSLNDGESCRELGFAYFTGRHGAPGRNLRKAYNGFKSACELDDFEGCNRLGRMYEAGDVDGPPNFDEAIKYYARACSAEFGLACTNLGAVFKDGLGNMQIDERRALGLFIKACNLDNALGCSYLGSMHRDGEGGLSRNLDQAEKYFEQSCALAEGESLFHGGNAGCVNLRLLRSARFFGVYSK